jgi:hypothetical protein
MHHIKYMSTNEISKSSIWEVRTDLAQNAGRTNSRVKEAPISFPKLYDQLGFQQHVCMTEMFSAQQRNVFEIFY